jgi:hypothetical protein
VAFFKGLLLLLTVRSSNNMDDSEMESDEEVAAGGDANPADAVMNDDDSGAHNAGGGHGGNHAGFGGGGGGDGPNHVVVALNGTELIARYGNRHPTMFELYGPWDEQDQMSLPTWKALKSMAKHWVRICAGVTGYAPWPLWQDRPHYGLGMLSSAFRPILNPTMDNLNLDFIDAIFRWVANNYEHPSILTRLKTWFNWHIKFEAHVYGLHLSDRFTITNSVGSVSRSTRRVARRFAIAGRDSGVDMQAFLDSRIEPQQKIALMMSGLNTDNVVLSRAKRLTRLNFCCIFCKAFQTMQRGVDYRESRFDMQLMQLVENVGPNGGTVSPHMITNHGKTNQMNRYEYRAFLRTRSPILDPAAWDGCMLLYRFCKMGEPFIDVDNKDSYQMRYMYCHVDDRFAMMDEIAMIRHWKSQYRQHEVICKKQTHQPRVQGQKELDSRGVREAQIARHAGHKSRGSAKSEKMLPSQEAYIDTPAIGAMVAAAGGDWEHPECHNPAWGMNPRSPDTQALLDRLINMVLPGLIPAYDRARVLFEQCNADWRLLKTRCLFMAKGFTAYLRHAVESAFLMLASRPVLYVDGRWQLQSNSPVLFEMTDNTNPDSVFSLQAFGSAEFDALKLQVQVRQNEERDGVLNLEPQVETVLVQRITQSLQPQLQGIRSQVESIRVGQDQLRADFLGKVDAFLEAERARNEEWREEMRQWQQNNGGAQIQPNLLPPALAPMAPQMLVQPQPQPAAAVTAAVAAAATAAVLAVVVPPATPGAYRSNTHFAQYCDGCPQFAFSENVDVNHSPQEYWVQFDVGRDGMVAFKRLERRWGTLWRKKIHPTWWGRRRSIYILVLYFKSTHPLEDFQSAIARATAIYDRGRSTNGHRNKIKSDEAIRAFFRANNVK